MVSCFPMVLCCLSFTFTFLFFDAQSNADVSATVTYGFDFHAAVSRDNIHGVQFHPESHHWGEQLLSNFVKF